MNTLFVSTSIREDEPITTSAEQLAELIYRQICHNHEPLLVSFKGLRGIPSSFYNTLLSVLKTKTGETVPSTITFYFDSDLQRSVFERAKQSFENKKVIDRNRS